MVCFYAELIILIAYLFHLFAMLEQTYCLAVGIFSSHHRPNCGERDSLESFSTLSSGSVKPNAERALTVSRHNRQSSSGWSFSFSYSIRPVTTLEFHFPCLSSTWFRIPSGERSPTDCRKYLFPLLKTRQLIFLHNIPFTYQICINTL